MLVLSGAVLVIVIELDIECGFVLKVCFFRIIFNERSLNNDESITSIHVRVYTNVDGNDLTLPDEVSNCSMISIDYDYEHEHEHDVREAHGEAISERARLRARARRPFSDRH